MARERKFTDEQMFAACDALHQRGENVSQQALMRELGGGGFRVLAQAIQAWQETKSLASLANTFDPHLLRSILAVQTAMQEKASKDADGLIEKERTAIQRERDAMQAKASADSALIATLQAQLDGMARALDDSRDRAAGAALDAAQGVTRIGDLEGQLASRLTEVATLRNALDAEQRRVNDLLQATNEANRLNTKRYEAMENLVRQNASNQVASLESKLAVSNDKLTLSQGQLNLVREQLEKQAQEHVQLRANMDAKDTMLTDLRRQLDEAQASLKEATASLIQMAGKKSAPEPSPQHNANDKSTQKT